MKMKKLSKHKLLKISLLGSAALFLLSCATNPVTGRQDFVTMTEGQEVQLGNTYHKQLLKQYPLYNDPELQAYINDIGQRLASKSHRSNLNFKFYLVDSPQVNAFAVPGGHIYITRGIMAYMQDEAQLAGVIGHEIGHVTARHGVKQSAQSQLAGILTAAVAIGTGSSEVAKLSNTLGGALISGYGREHELQSDRLGAEYLAKAGYDSRKMIEVVGILKDQELASKARALAEGRQPATYHGLFSTHPRNDTRLKQVVSEADKYAVPQRNIANSEKFMRLMNNVTYGQSEAQGIVKDNKFYHKGLDFYLEFPQGWKIQNETDRIVAQDPNTKHAIIMQSSQIKESLSAPQFLQKHFSKFNSGQRVRTSEDQAYAGRALVGEGQQARNAYVGTVYRGNTAFVMVGLGNSSSLPSNAVLKTLSSVRRLNRADQQHAKETKLKTIRVQRGQTFAQLAKRSPSLEKYAEQELRLLNGMFPSGEPRPGQLIKIVQ